MGVHLYYFLPESDESPVKTNPLLSTNVLQMQSEIKELLETIEALDCFMAHEDYDRFYDSDNLKAFLYPIQQLREMYPFKYERLIKDSFKNMRNCRIARLNFNNDEVTHLIIICGGIEIEEDRLQLEFQDSQQGYMVEFRYCQDQKGVAEWFFDNRRPIRKYDYGYEKHGENGKGAWKGNDEDGRPISVLMGSKEDAAILLKKAIGKSSQSSRSWCYDHQYGRYMEFRNEHNNLFHSYHLETKRETEIPKVVKNKIDLWK